MRPPRKPTLFLSQRLPHPPSVPGPVHLSSLPSAQVASRYKLTCGSLPLKLHCCFLSASALHSSCRKKGSVGGGVEDVRAQHHHHHAPHPSASSSHPEGQFFCFPLCHPLPSLASLPHHLTSWYSPPGRKLELLLRAKRASRAPTYRVLPSLLSRRAV